MPKHRRKTIGRLISSLFELFDDNCEKILSELVEEREKYLVLGSEVIVE